MEDDERMNEVVYDYDNGKANRKQTDYNIENEL